MKSRFTNKLGLPKVVVDAISTDDYERGEKTDFSVTELLRPPRISVLSRKHKDEIEQDVSDMMAAFEGKILHKILENANKSDLAEERFYHTIDGHVISGQIDSLAWDDESPGVLSDWKRTSTFKLNKVDADWEFQLNVQNFLLNKNGVKPKGLQIVAWGKDHSKVKAMTDERYPQSPIAKIPIPMWDEDRALGAIRERIKLHVEARESLPECTDDERWKRFNRDFKKVIPLRCALYCSVAKFCSQYQDELTSQETF